MIRLAPPVALPLLAALALASLAAPAPAQGGYTTQRHKEAGMDFPVPRRYEPMPLQPTERWILFKFLEDARETKEQGRRLRPEVSIVDLPYVPDPAPETGATAAAPETEGEAGAQDAEEAKEEKEAKPELPITSFERYLERRLQGWSVAPGSEQTDRERRGWTPTTYRLEGPQTEKHGRVGFAYVWRKPREREVLLIGFCHVDDYDHQADIWDHMGDEMSLYEPRDDAREKLERFYSRRGYPDPDYRIRVRLRLPKGWEAEDTDHYIVVYNTPDQPLVRKIVRDLEEIREQYVELFPPAGEIEAVSTVRVCANRGEYLHFSGLPTSAGYWNPRTEELVLYDATIREKGEKTDKSDTFIVLYHEAFHQYIHYSAGELAPHSWFNEGYGDFFSGALLSGGSVRKIGPNPWRVRTIQRAVEQRKHVPWREIVRYEQKDYYSNAAVCYSQGWSMVYFLETDREVQRDERLSRILPLYFETLKARWKEELGKLAAAGDEEEPEKLHQAQLAARTAAVDAAFDGVDLDALEARWVEFVRDLEDPRGR